MNHCPLMHHSFAIVCSVCTYFTEWVHFEHCASCYATIVFLPPVSTQNLIPAKLPSAPSKSLWWAKLTHISMWACKKALQAVFSSKFSFFGLGGQIFLSVLPPSQMNGSSTSQWSSAGLTSLAIHRPKSLRAIEFFWICICVIVLYLSLLHSKSPVLYLYCIVFVFVFVFELDLAPLKPSAGQ